MRSATSALRIGAVVFAVALGGAYVWFRSAQAGEGQSRVLPGSKIGSSVELARRKGDDWYIAVLNCSTKARTTEVDLSWLDASAKELVLYRDGASNEFCEINTMPIPESRKLKFEVLHGGGLIAHIRAQKAFTGWK